LIFVVVVVVVVLILVVVVVVDDDDNVVDDVVIECFFLERMCTSFVDVFACVSKCAGCE